MNIKTILTKYQVKRLKLMLKNTLYTKYKKPDRDIWLFVFYILEDLINASLRRKVSPTCCPV